MVTADINNDGKLDLVVGNLGGPNAVYINNGNGTVAAAAPFGEPTNQTNSVAVADINRDGWLDVVAGGYGQGSIYLNDKQGRLPTSATLRFGI